MLKKDLKEDKRLSDTVLEEIAGKITRPLVDTIKYFHEPFQRRVLFLLYAVNLTKPAALEEISSILDYPYKRVWVFVRDLEKKGIVKPQRISAKEWGSLKLGKSIRIHLLRGIFKQKLEKFRGKPPTLYMYRDLCILKQAPISELAKEESLMLIGKRFEKEFSELMSIIDKKYKSEILTDASYVWAKLQPVFEGLKSYGILKFELSSTELDIQVTTAKEEYNVTVPLPSSP
jgi:hypothetical protein